MTTNADTPHPPSAPAAPPSSHQSPAERRRTRERAARVDRIRAAATRVFGRRGYEGATMALIAAEAEMGKASLYHYYPSKTALFGELVRDAAEELAVAVAQRVAPQTDPYETISVYLRESVHLFARHPEFAAVHRRAATAGPALVRELAGEGAAGAVAHSHAPLGRAIELVAQRLPRGRAEALPRLIASFLLGLGARVEGTPPGAPEPAAQVAALDQEVALFVDALRALTGDTTNQAAASPRP